MCAAATQVLVYSCIKLKRLVYSKTWDAYLSLRLLSQWHSHYCIIQRVFIKAIMIYESTSIKDFVAFW
jgi:hypothetical protein